MFNFVKRLFGSVKQQVQRYLPIPSWLHQKATWMKHNYETFAKEGYSKNEVVYACIRIKARAAPSAVLRVYKYDRDNNKVYLPDHPLQKLLDKPNPFMDQNELLEMKCSHENIIGNAFWHKVRSRAGRVVELWPRRPDRVKIIPDSENFIGGYELWNGEKWVPVPADDVIHFKLFNPLNDFWGLPPLASAARSVDVDNETSEFVKTLLENKAVPGGVLETDKQIDKDIRERMEEYWQERFSRHNKGLGRIAVVHQGMKYKSVGLNLQEMTFKDLRSMDETRICMAFSVPPIMVGAYIGLLRSTYANYREAQRSLWEEALVPEVGQTVSRLNRFLAPEFGEGIFIEADFSKVTALQEQEGERWNRASVGVRGKFLLVNEAREMVGLEPVPGGNVFLHSPTDFPVSLGLEGSKSPPAAAVKDLPTRDFKVFNLETDEQKAEFFKAFDRARWGWVGKVKGDVEEVFNEERERIVSAVRRADIGNVGSVISGQIAGEVQEQWTNFLARTYVDITDYFGSRVYRDITGKARGKDWDPWAPAVQEWVRRESARQVVNITSTTEWILEGAVRNAIDEGWGINRLADYIDQNIYLEQIIPYRSEVIARTETLRCSNFGSISGARATEAPLDKEWLTAIDGREREAHHTANGQRRDINEPFLVWGEELDFPGDPQGRPENTIQCRCTTVYRRKGE